jgi:hypothetical protein
VTFRPQAQRGEKTLGGAMYRRTDGVETRLEWTSPLAPAKSGV